MHWIDNTSGWWIVMVIGMLLFWAAVIAVIVLLIRNYLPRRSFSLSTGQQMETARDILDRRLAAGEISPDEYQHLRNRLEE